MFIFCIGLEIRFLDRFVKKKSKQFTMKVDNLANSNMPNSMIVFITPALDAWLHFWANLLQKIKNFCSRWKLVPRVIPIYSIRWQCSFVLVGTRNTLFKKIYSEKLRWQCKRFLFWKENTLFGQFSSKKLKLSV